MVAVSGATAMWPGMAEKGVAAAVAGPVAATRIKDTAVAVAQRSIRAKAATTVDLVEVVMVVTLAQIRAAAAAAWASPAGMSIAAGAGWAVRAS